MFALFEILTFDSQHIWSHGVAYVNFCAKFGVCVKCGSAGADMCKMLETVRVISCILHMVNGDPSQGKS